MKPLDILSENLLMPVPEILEYVARCPYRYKRFEIEKRNGGKRKIAQPTPDLKFVQRMLLDVYLKKILPVHDAATAYVQGGSIVKNAQIHSKNSYILKMDFKEFFSSIKSTDLELRMVKLSGLDDSDHINIHILSKVFFMRENDELILSMGAPSSPFISNAMLYDFDLKVSTLCSGLGISYSRYSDDLTFSSQKKGDLFGIPGEIKEITGALTSPNLFINEGKTIFTSKATNRRVTGVTINNQGELSLGRERKRSIRTLIYMYSKNELEMKEVYSLCGYLSYAKSVEPSFTKSLHTKYPKEMRELTSLNTNFLARRFPNLSAE